MGFVANFICFPVRQKFKNQLRFEKVIENLKMETFLRHSVVQRKEAGWTNIVLSGCHDVRRQ